MPRKIESPLRLVMDFPITSYFKSYFQDYLIKIIRTGPIPKHIALVMDGNRRFAKQKNMALKDGHNAGAESLSQVIDVAYRLGIHTVTIYAFSIENFNRPKVEVDTLFNLFRTRITKMSSEGDFADKSNLRIKILGNRSLLPDDMLESMENAERLTAHNTKNVLNICFPYTGRDDMAQAMKKCVEKISTNELKQNDLSIDFFTSQLYTGDSPPLDILVRTSGHTRLSDFMLWECHENCTIEFVDVLWPNFKFWEMYKVVMKWSYFRVLELSPSTEAVKDKPKSKVTKLLELRETADEGVDKLKTFAMNNICFTSNEKKPVNDEVILH